MKVIQIQNNIEFKGSRIIPSGYRAFIDKDLINQIDTIIVVLKNVYQELPKYSEDFCKNHGIEKVYNSLEKGVTIQGEDVDYIVSIHKNNDFRLRVQNKINKLIRESIYVHQGQIAKTDTRYRVPEDNEMKYFQFKENIRDSENVLRTSLQTVDFRLLELRKLIFGNKIAERVIVSPNVEIKPSDNKTNIRTTIKPNSKQPKKTQKINEPTNEVNERGLITGLQLETIENIRAQFIKSHENLAKFKNSRTRNIVKNGYGKIEKGVAGSKVLTFKVNGTWYREISVNMINDHYKRNLVITAKDYSGSTRNIVITPENEIFKTPPVSIIRDANKRTKKIPLTYFTQKEIDSQNLMEIFKILEIELTKYNKYIETKSQELSSKKVWHSTTQEGNLDKYQKALKSIKRKYEYFKKNMPKYSSNAKDRETFKRRNDLQTFLGFPYLLMKEITPDRKSVFLAYPKIRDKETAKILILDKDEVINTFLIIDNKMMKYKAKSIFSRGHYDRTIYYYTQREIDSFGLEAYLEVINRHLEKVNKLLQEKIEQ